MGSRQAYHARACIAAIEDERMSDYASAKAFATFQSLLVQSTGIRLDNGGDGATIDRLRPLLTEYGLASVEELAARIDRGTHPALRQRVVETLTDQDTAWFRDAVPFSILRDTVFPDLAARHRHNVRIWSAGCASGEEAYSISMTYQDYIEASPKSLPEPVILATDLCTDALNFASRGVFGNVAEAGNLPADYRRRFFTPSDGGWQVTAQIRRRVTFRQFNLLETGMYLGRFDIVFCRNIIEHLDMSRRRTLIHRLASVLRPSGYLFLGLDESIGDSNPLFEVQECAGHRVYRRR